MKKTKKILGACLGNCVHVAGIISFLKLAQAEGYSTHFIGTAVPVDVLIEHIKKEKPTVVAISYRLTPEVAQNLLKDLKKKVEQQNLRRETRFILGGTKPVADVAKALDLFDAVFSPESQIDDIIYYLRQQEHLAIQEKPPQDVISRIKYKHPYPILRHHYGRPSLEETIQGIRDVAQAEVLDVLSLGPDQNAQQFFFHPEKMDSSQSGAGGVPIRTRSDLKQLYQSTRCGNYPLMRCYSGTNDLLKMGALLLETIHNAWATIPLCWYNVLDGRSERGLDESISGNLDAVAWHAQKNVPVEINESHHWSLRDTHDTVAIASAYLAAYNAKKRGVKNYISQYMLNTPPGTVHVMDIAKMLAQIELVESLHDSEFTSYRQFRAGLFSFPGDQGKAKGQLGASTYLAMALKPHIIHVVGYCEGNHAALASEVIESCNIAQQVIDVCVKGMSDMTLDPRIGQRKEELLDEAKTLINAFYDIASSRVDDPLSDPATITRAIRVGILDAPHLAGNPHAKGELMTKEIGGAYYAIDPVSNQVLTEKERIGKITANCRRNGNR